MFLFLTKPQPQPTMIDGLRRLILCVFLKCGPKYSTLITIKHGNTEVAAIVRLRESFLLLYCVWLQCSLFLVQS